MTDGVAFAELKTNAVYLAPAEYIDSDHPAIGAFVAKTVSPDMPAAEKARRFYLAAREIRYDPDLDYADPEIYRASSVLEAGRRLLRRQGGAVRRALPRRRAFRRASPSRT